MSDAPLTQLKIAVERAVRPVGATMARKRQMREELLAHLAAIFQEELGKTGDEQKALATARRRFGDSAELSRQLQEVVSWWDRFAAIIELPNKALYYGPHKSVFHLAGKHLLFMGVCYAILILIILLPCLLTNGRHLENGLAFYLAFRVAVVMGAVSATLSFLAAVVPCEIGRSLYGRNSERSTRRGAAFSLASLFIFPAVAFFTYWGFTGDLAGSLHHLWLGCCFAPVAPVVFAMMSRKVLEERRYEEEWASLTIEE